MAEAHYDISIQKERLHLLLNVIGKNTFINTLLAAILAYMQSTVLPIETVLIWFVAVLQVNIIRYFIGLYFIKHPVDKLKQIRTRLHVFRAGVIVSALVWAVNSFLVYGNGLVEHRYEQELFVIYMLAGISAGAAVGYAIDLVAALAFTFFAILPTLVAYFFSGNHTLVAMSISGFLYIMFITFSIKVFNQNLIEGIKLRLEAVKNADEIKRLAFYDTLTNLPNRRLLLERLERAFLQNWRTGKRSALLFIDLDNFKQLNDSEGHDIGDMLLMKVAHRLDQSVRASDTVARFGGDEFVLILENLNEHYDVAVEEAEMVTQQILASLNKPYQLIEFAYTGTPSIGIAMFGEHGRTQKDLLKHADIAMYTAKQSGKNNYRFFNEDMHVQE